MFTRFCNKLLEFFNCFLTTCHKKDGDKKKHFVTVLESLCVLGAPNCYNTRLRSSSVLFRFSEFFVVKNDWAQSACSSENWQRTSWVRALKKPENFETGNIIEPFLCFKYFKFFTEPPKCLFFRQFGWPWHPVTSFECCREHCTIRGCREHCTIHSARFMSQLFLIAPRHVVVCHWKWVVQEVNDVDLFHFVSKWRPRL